MSVRFIATVLLALGLLCNCGPVQITWPPPRPTPAPTTTPAPPSPSTCPPDVPAPPCPPGQYRETDGHNPFPCPGSIWGRCVASDPQPTPAPAPTPVPPAPCSIAALPVNAVRPLSANESCKPGFEAVVHQGKTYCLAESDTRADIGDGPGICHPCPAHIRGDLQQGHIRADGGWLVEDSGVLRDAYCRRSIDGSSVIAGEAGTWKYQGDCPPRAQAACPPTPAPTPRPTPTPSATPSAPPAPNPAARCTLPIARFGIGFFGKQGAKTNYQGTFRFGGGNGKPCDGSHMSCSDPRYDGVGQCEPCGGAVCEDSRGGQWSAGDGAELVSVSGGEPDPACPNCGYHASVKGTSGWVKACPPPNPRSRQDGSPLAVSGNACSSVRLGEK